MKLKDFFKKSSAVTEDISKRLRECRLSLEEIDSVHRSILADRWGAEDTADEKKVIEIDQNLQKARNRRDSLTQRLETLKAELRESIEQAQQAKIDAVGEDIATLEGERDELTKEALSGLARGLFLLTTLYGIDERSIIWSFLPQRELRSKLSASTINSSPLSAMFVEAENEARRQFVGARDWKNRRGELAKQEHLSRDRAARTLAVENRFKQILAGT